MESMAFLLAAEISSAKEAKILLAILVILSLSCLAKQTSTI